MFNDAKSLLARVIIKYSNESYFEEGGKSILLRKSTHQV